MFDEKHEELKKAFIKGQKNVLEELRELFMINTRHEHINSPCFCNQVKDLFYRKQKEMKNNE